MLDVNKIEEIRKLKFRTQLNFCEKIGLSVKGYTNALNRKDFKYTTLEKIAEVLEIPISYFFYDEKSKNYNNNENNINVVNDNKSSYGSDLKKENAALKKEIKYLKEINELLKKEK